MNYPMVALFYWLSVLCLFAGIWIIRRALEGRV